MEFTPKKVTSSAIRHNPYASKGKHFNGFRKGTNGSLPNVTPSRKFNLFNCKSKNSNVLTLKPKALLRSENILKASQVQNNKKENSNIFKNTGQSPHNKSVYSSLDASKDPFSIFSDEDDDVPLSTNHDKKNDLDKENNNISIKKNVTKPVTTSSCLKKPINLVNSTILHDISPKKVKLALDSKENIIKTEEPKSSFKFTSLPSNKKPKDVQNGSTEKEVSNSHNFEHPHMVGFPNFGNTCYLNAVLQSIISFYPFIMDLQSALEQSNISQSSIATSLWNIIAARQKLDFNAIRKSLRLMKKNMEKIDCSFSGFKMQDANEFLTQVLDTVKEELDGCHKKRQVNGCVKDISLKKECLDDKNNNKTVGSIFGTPNSLSPLSLEINIKEDEQNFKDDDIFLTPKRARSESESMFITPKRDELISPPEKEIQSPENIFFHDFLKKDVPNFINPIKNNFEFELQESYSCLGCSEKENQKQKHMALYVDLPETESEENSIQSAVQVYMRGEVERELKCANCSFGRAAIQTSFSQMPRLLIVQMKRYTYKAEELQCVKMSSKVGINTWLHLDEFVDKDASSPTNFNTAVINNFDSCENFTGIQKESRVELQSTEKQQEAIPLPASGQSDNCELSDKDKEDKELEEALLRSLQESGNDTSMSSDKEKEEAELQEAIKLSLQDAAVGFHCNGAAHEDDDVTKHELSNGHADNTREASASHSYHLMSIISHFGLTTSTGHYVSDTLQADEGRWFHYDDESVCGVSQQAVLSEARQKNGYVFFYVHQDTYDVLKNSKTFQSNRSTTLDQQ